MLLLLMIIVLQIREACMIQSTVHSVRAEPVWHANHCCHGVQKQDGAICLAQFGSQIQRVSA